ncbi:MAG: hypothetical protein HDR88_02275 [Bacteroides sp.]|nr:hypothetical protein [Bacteroides sp.]
MKKHLLFGLVCLGASGVYAQSTTEPLILPEFYAFKISPDGRWLYSNTGSGEIIIYDLETSQHNEFYELTLGNGNAIALDGTSVGSTDMGEAVILKGEDEIYPDEFSKYWYSSPAAITADGTRISGVVGNNGTSDLDDDKQYYFPFVADIDTEGNVSGITVLPHPEQDFFGMTPQYCSATWISNSGKIILGQVVDNSGMFLQPIVYRQSEDGEWTYTLPTESIFNPDNIPLPDYPGAFTLKAVDPADFISDEEKREEYLEDMEWWETEGNFDQDLYPGDHLGQYMALEEIEVYNKAADEYNQAAEEYNERIEEYYIARNAILNTSVSFLRNGFCMNGDGTVCALASNYDIEIDEMTVVQGHTTYILDLNDDSLKEIKPENTSIIPTQVLNGGIILASTSSSEVQASYVYMPGTDDYMPIEEYFATTNPYAADWLQDNLVQPLYDGSLAMISGCGVASDDFSVFASGVPAYMFDEEFVYFSYIFSGLTSGVKEVTAPDNSGLKVLADGVLAINGEINALSIMDLSGKKVFEMHNASGTLSTGLGHGIYVITYTDTQGQIVAKKVMF